MAQAKKTSSASAKLASSVANKAASKTYAAVESTRSSAENVVKIGSRAAKDFMSTSAGEAQKAQEKIFALGREGADQIAKSADAISKAMMEAISTSRENIDSVVECSNVTASLAKEMSEELMEFANQSFTDQVELSKELFACRTINDVMEWQSRAVRNLMDSSFSQSTRLSNMLFEYSAEALEPLNERISENAEKLSKALANA